MTPSPSDPGPEEAPLPLSLRLLKTLVLTLLVVMILGTLLVVALLTTRLNTPPSPSLPAEITLPDGARATAVTRGSDWIAIVSEDDRILIYDAKTGALRQSIEIKTGE